MTMMAHYLLRLRGDEDWEAWGENWWDHVDQVCELRFVDGWMWAPEWLRQRKARRWRRERRRHQLDWGAVFYEVSKDELRRLIGLRPDYSDIRADWDEPFCTAEREQNALLDALPDDGRYGVVWVECY